MAKTLRDFMIPTGTDLSKGSPNPYVPLGVQALKDNPLFAAMHFLTPAELDPLANSGGSTRVTQSYMISSGFAQFRKTFTEYAPTVTLPETNDLYLREVGGSYLYDTMVERGFRGNKQGQDLWDKDQMLIKIDEIKNSFEQNFILGTKATIQPGWETPPAGAQEHIERFNNFMDIGNIESSLGIPPSSMQDAIKIQTTINKLASKFVDGQPNFIITNQFGKEILDSTVLWANMGVKQLTYNDMTYAAVRDLKIIVLDNTAFRPEDIQYIKAGHQFTGAPMYMVRIGSKKTDANVVIHSDGKILDMISPLDYLDGNSVRTGKVTMLYANSFGSPTCVGRVLFARDEGLAGNPPILTTDPTDSTITSSVADIRWPAVYQYNYNKDETAIVANVWPCQVAETTELYNDGRIVYSYIPTGEVDPVEVTVMPTSITVIPDTLTKTVVYPKPDPIPPAPIEVA